MKCTLCGCTLSLKESKEVNEAMSFDPSTKALCDECFQDQEGMIPAIDEVADGGGGL